MAKILFLTPQLPYPPEQGTSLRNFHLIKGLAANHRLFLLSFLEKNQTVAAQAIEPLSEMCEQITALPVPQRSNRIRLQQLLTTRLPDMGHRLASTDFSQHLEAMLRAESFDIVQIEGIELARYSDLVRIIQPEAALIFDDHNAETELQRRNLRIDMVNPRRWLAAGYSLTQVSRLRRFEQWACTQADWVTAVSETDKAHLEAIVGNRVPITVIPNCIDTQQFQQAGPAGAGLHFDLVFTGKMDYRPNVDAVIWFADHVWPRIRVALPGVSWAIVGQKPHARLQRVGEMPGITLTGWVKAVAPYITGADLFIMPFRIGSGTRLKLIEAMAAGKAIVSTAVGAEGFPVNDGRELVLADSAEAMAASVVALLGDRQHRLALGEAARLFAADYDWRLVVPRFEPIYARLLEERA